MMIASDTSRLFGVGSGGTVLLGAGPTAISAGSFPGGAPPQRAYWAQEFGVDSMVSSNGSASYRIVTLPNSGYSGAPYVFVSQYTTNSSFLQDSIHFTVRSITKTQFVVSSQYLQTDSPQNVDVTFVWQSIGTRTL